LEGSAEAYRQIVRRYERPLLSLIRRMVKNHEMAEDLAQDVLIKAFRHLSRYDPQRKFSSWLFKIAHNATIDHLRRKQLPLVPLESSSSDGTESWEVLPAPANQEPDQVAERAEVMRGLSTALGRLNPPYREILLLRFQQGLAYHEIVEITGQKMGTVKIKLHRARKQLLVELGSLNLGPGSLGLSEPSS
jgi:RNA polymerase sigma-70 factor (ECF subfamily)